VAAILNQSGKFYSGCNVENARIQKRTVLKAGAIASMFLMAKTSNQDIYVDLSWDLLVRHLGCCRQKIREFIIC